MKRQLRGLTLLIVVVISTISCAAFPGPSDYSIVTTPDELSIEPFLSQWPRYYRIESGTRVGFTGDFRKLPSGLEAELEEYFPEYAFSIAEMWFLHWGPEDVNLIVVTDRESGSVVSYAWAPWFDASAGSLQFVVNQYKWGAYCSGSPIARALAHLLALAGDRNLGKMEAEDFFGGSGLVCRMAFPLLSKDRTRQADQEVVVEVHNHSTAWLTIGPVGEAPSSN